MRLPFPSPSMLLAGVALWACLGTAHAAQEVDTGQVRVRLVPSVRAVLPGERITVGLQQRIIPHWHTYWRNPGDSGLASTLEWTLPAGAVAGDIQWPLPSRFQLGPVTNHGYSDEVTLLTEVTVPQDARPGGTLPLQVKANWLVCQETCIPQEATLQMALPVVSPGTARPPADPLIAAARRRLPLPAPWPVAALAEGGGLVLHLPGAAQDLPAGRDLWFYADDWGRVIHGAAQRVTRDGADVRVHLQPGEAPVQVGQPLAGVLTVSAAGQPHAVPEKGYTVQVAVAPGRPGPAGGQAAMVPPPPSEALVERPPTAAALAADQGPWAALALAFAGGLILNLMPCVFPVLSIKALSLLQHRDHVPARARLHGLAYTAGVLVTFGLLAGLLIGLKAGGAQVGWGFQFQSPAFVLVVAYLMFAVGLSLSGVFTLGSFVAGVGSSLAERPGYTGSFFTGALATVVATPCTAPFMGGAIGYALTQPAPVVLAVFLSLGLGLALPYLLLCLWPALQRLLPRPGLWMERLKQAFAFPMYGAAAWLVWVLAQQAGVDAVALALAGMIAIAFGAWLFDSTRASRGWWRPAGTALAVATLAAALSAAYLGTRHAQAAGGPAAVQAADAPQGGQVWQAYTAERLDGLRREGRPVLLNMTAAWCITCLINERVALNTPAVAQALGQRGITYLKGDWTRQDPAITQLLARFGRSGVPLYVFYPPGPESAPVVLPQVLTTGIVLSALSGAGTSSVSSSLPFSSVPSANR